MDQNVAVVFRTEIYNLYTYYTIMKCTVGGGTGPWWPPESKHSCMLITENFYCSIIGLSLNRSCN